MDKLAQENERLHELLEEIANEAYGTEWLFESGFHSWVYQTIRDALDTEAGHE